KQFRFRSRPDPSIEIPIGAQGAGIVSDRLSARTDFPGWRLEERIHRRQREHVRQGELFQSGLVLSLVMSEFGRQQFDLGIRLVPTFCMQQAMVTGSDSQLFVRVIVTPTN